MVKRVDLKTAAPADGRAGTDASAVHAHLRDAILDGKLEPGEIISQVKLAEQLETSRTPLREALRMLQREGLVEGEANRRVRVSSLSLVDLDQLYALRIVTEALAIRLAVPLMTAEDDTLIEKAVEAMDAAAAKREVGRWEREHRNFHQLLVSRSGARTVQSAADLLDHSERYRRLYIAHDSQVFAVGSAEHREIAAACRERDEQRASRLLGRHLLRTAVTVMATESPEFEPRAVRVALRSVDAGKEPPAPAPKKRRRRAPRAASP